MLRLVRLSQDSSLHVSFHACHISLLLHIVAFKLYQIFTISLPPFYYRTPTHTHAHTRVPVNMCYQVIERYSVCRCLYYKHAIDPCAAHGQRGHGIQEKTVLVGYACSTHSNHRPQAYHTGVLPDSGYGSGEYSPAYLR